MEIRALIYAMYQRKTGPVLVAMQVAVTLAVVVNVAYLVQLRLADANRPTGLDLSNMFWIVTQPSTADYSYFAAVKMDLAYLNALPGVVAASTTNNLPQTWATIGLPFSSNPQILHATNGGIPGTIYFGTEKFIDALGLKLIAGRNFDPNSIAPPAADMGASIGAWAPEMILTQAMAQKLFPKGDALGKNVYAGLINKSSVVVGIVDLMRANPVPADADQVATQVVIVPIVPAGPNGVYIVRTKPGRRDEIMAQLDKNFADEQPGRFVARMEAYDRTSANARRDYRVSAIILTVVAFWVLAVTMVGIVGLTAFNVTMRTKQLGTRRAIGARKFHILRYFLVENWIIITSGAALGCPLALAAGAQLSRMYQMPRIPLYYLIDGVLLLWIVGLLAVLVPAFRAASVAPAVATRTV
jgi:putative ABC transport system permease protein